MSEDHKLADAGDYNLLRYCHNDPIDSVDPMGLEMDYAQTGPPTSASHTASMMQAEDYGQLMGKVQWAMRWSTQGAIGMGMAGYNAWSAVSKSMGVTVTGQVIGKVNPANAPWGDPNESNAPGKLEILPDKTEDRGANKVFHLQVETKEGKWLTQPGNSIENVNLGKPTGNLKIQAFDNTNGVPVAFRKGGEILDRVGLSKSPGVNAHGDIVNHQTYQVIYGGFRYQMRPAFEQHIHVENGFVFPALVPVNF